MTIVSKDVLDLLDTSDNRCSLAIALNKSEMQIRRYIKLNDIMLTTYDALQAIKKLTGKKLTEILTQKVKEVIVSDGNEEQEPVTEKV